MRALPCLFLLCCACRPGAGVSMEITPLDPGGSINTHVGGMVSLNCRVEGGEAEERLEEEMEWHRDGQLVKLDPHNHFSPSRLCLHNITVDDHQVTYTCHLKRNPTIAASAQIKVHFPPALSGSEQVTVEETMDAVLLCSVWAYPQVTVAWLRDEQPLDLVTHGCTIYQDSREARLTITNIHKEQQQGLYSCVTQSAEFGERIKTFQLLVQDKKMSFPVEPLIAAVVVVACTALLAIVSRWDKIRKCCK